MTDKIKGSEIDRVWFDEMKDIVIDINEVESVTLRRLIQEVTVEKTSGSPHYYNRIHNRHNRS